MKNIHILQTDKPSRLISSGKEFTLLKNSTTDKRCENIYITSDEEIKDGDWMIRGNEQPTLVTPNFFWDFGVRYYKIILTTDKDLIKDGIQAIDDEFLEWFVKNPSCEEVGIKVEFIQTPDYLKDGFYYKIIIPQEEPKQETLEEFIEREGYPKGITQEIWEDGVRLGAKWQQEKNYSEKDLILFYDFIENYQLRKYGDVWRRITNNPNVKPFNCKSVDDKYVIEWFEQFKKKSL
jgi:hypothetical protein